MKPTVRKTNWYRCDFCGRRVTKVKPKGYDKPIVLSNTPVRIILDKNSTEEFWYNRSWVKGRVVQDGLKAYTRHKCPTRT